MDNETLVLAKKYTDQTLEGAGALKGEKGDPGVGIQSVTQTTTSTDSGGVNVVTVEKTDGTSSTFEVRNGESGPAGEPGPAGEKGDPGIGVPAGGAAGQILAKATGSDYDTKWVDASGGGGSGSAGEDGATFTPSVSADGTLSWTNDKGLSNPDPVNLMGPAGEPGRDGYLVQDAVVYSEQEQCIGVWTDGKPIYRRVINTTTPTEAETNTVVATIENYESLVNFEGYMQGCVPVNFVHQQSVNTGSYGSCAYINATGSIVMIIKSAYVNMPVRFIVEYTKTTDAAGSGTIYRPYVYSQEETVVGQWIDGKPIYRKTIECLSPTQKEVQTSVIDLSPLSVDRVCFIKGAVYPDLDNEPLWTMPVNCTTNGGYIACFVGTTIQMITNVAAYLNKPTIITIEYTKTTDQATTRVATVDELNAAYEEGVQSA